MSFHIAHGEGQHLMEALAGFAASSLSADGVFIMNGCVQCAPLKALEMVSSSLQACSIRSLSYLFLPFLSHTASSCLLPKGSRHWK